MKEFAAGHRKPVAQARMLAVSQPCGAGLSATFFTNTDIYDLLVKPTSPSPSSPYTHRPLKSGSLWKEQGFTC